MGRVGEKSLCASANAWLFGQQRPSHRKPASTKVVVTKPFWKDGTKSVSDIGCTEEQIIQHDAIALEDPSYVAT